MFVNEIHCTKYIKMWKKVKNLSGLCISILGIVSNIKMLTVYKFY